MEPVNHRVNTVFGSLGSLILPSEIFSRGRRAPSFCPQAEVVQFVKDRQSGAVSSWPFAMSTAPETLWCKLWYSLRVYLAGQAVRSLLSVCWCLSVEAVANAGILSVREDREVRLSSTDQPPSWSGKVIQSPGHIAITSWTASSV
jgi:hypothetical protein